MNSELLWNRAAASVGKWQAKYARLVAWVEENIEETLSFYDCRASITSTEEYYAGAAERGDQAPHPYRAHLPECGETCG